MRLRSTLLLALIFAALGAYLYLVERPRAAQEGVQEKLLELEAAAITGIALEHPGRKVTLERVDGTWRITEPLAAAADERSVDNILNAVRDAVVKRTLENAEAPATYGLDVPSATIQLRRGAENLPLLKIGKKAPIGGSAYLQRGDREQIYLVDQSIIAALDKQVGDLRDKTILSFAEEKVTSIALRGSKGEVELRKQGEGWRLEAPLATAADDTNVRALLTTLRSLRATDFASEDAADLSAFGLVEPAQQLTLGLDDGTEIALAVGAEKDAQLFVKSSQRPTVFTVANWARESLDKDAAHFRDKAILDFDSAAARALLLSRPDGALTLRRADSGEWSSDAGAPRPEAVDELLAALAALKGYEIAAEAPADLAAFGLEPAALTIQVRGADEADLGAVRLGSRAADGARTEYTARREGGETVFLIRDFTYQQLDKGPADLLIQATPTAAAAAP